MNDNKIFQKVLTIGVDINARGGVAYVLRQYKKHFQMFKYIKTTPYNDSGFEKIIIFIFALIKFLIILCFDKNILIIHFHTVSRNSFLRKYILFLIAKIIFSKKTIFHLHGGSFHKFYLNAPLLFKCLIRNYIEKSDLVICISDFHKSFINNNFNCRKIHTLNNIIEQPLHNPFPKKELFPVRFLFLGLICQRKGIWDLMDVIIENKEFLQGKACFNLAGNGEVTHLLSQIQDKELNQIVNYIGWIDREAKIDVLKENHIFILPSYIEALPVSVLEAMSYNMPVISTMVGGIPNLITHEKNGILIEPGNKDALFSAIEFFIKNKNKINNFGKNSKDIIRHYYPEPVIAKLEGIYRSLLDEH